MKEKLNRYIYTLADLVDQGHIAEEEFPNIPERVEILIAEIIEEIGHTLSGFNSLCPHEHKMKLKRFWKGFSSYQTFETIVRKEVYEID